MPKYQGHKSRACWNVALYLFNEYGLYTMVRRAVADATNLDDAASNILAELTACGLDKTPDGYMYSKTAVREALRHYER